MIVPISTGSIETTGSAPISRHRDWSQVYEKAMTFESIKFTTLHLTLFENKTKMKPYFGDFCYANTDFSLNSSKLLVFGVGNWRGLLWYHITAALYYHETSRITDITECYLQNWLTHNTTSTHLIRLQ